MALSDNIVTPGTQSSAKFNDHPSAANPGCAGGSELESGDSVGGERRGELAGTVNED